MFFFCHILARFLVLLGFFYCFQQKQLLFFRTQHIFFWFFLNPYRLISIWDGSSAFFPCIGINKKTPLVIGDHEVCTDPQLVFHGWRSTKATLRTRSLHGSTDCFHAKTSLFELCMNPQLAFQGILIHQSNKNTNYFFLRWIHSLFSIYALNHSLFSM